MSYIPAVMNPLRRLPIRQYQGPLRNRLPGLGALNCPGDPGCPGNPNPVDIGTSAVVDVTPSTTTITTPQGSQTVPTPGGGSTLTDWLNQNSSTVLWIAGIGLGVMFLSRLTR